jgi:GTP-binding protein Era
MRSGFATIAGRPNVGKSTLINTIIGEKVTITSSRPNTTRHQIRGVLTRPDAQVVFIDTPGIHRPKTRLGERLNESAYYALQDVEVLVALIEASATIGPGDKTVLTRSLEAAAAPDGPRLIVAVNKMDKAGPAKTAEQLTFALKAVEEIASTMGPRAIDAADRAEFFPISAKTGRGVPALLEAIVANLDEGPAFYPEEMISDQGDAAHVAELVREQLLSRTKDELPHSIHCQVTEWEGNAIRVEILVERDSQKAIVIGKGGSMLKEVGTEARKQLPPGTHLELFVRVEKRWQSRTEVLDRFGY